MEWNEVMAGFIHNFKYGKGESDPMQKDHKGAKGDDHGFDNL